LFGDVASLPEARAPPARGAWLRAAKYRRWRNGVKGRCATREACETAL